MGPKATVSVHQAPTSSKMSVLALLVVAAYLVDACLLSMAQHTILLPARLSVSLPPQAPVAAPGRQLHLLEDKDYPRSLFEDYTKHVGQVSGITTLANNDVVIFHRADRHWTRDTFNETTNRVAEPRAQDKLIKSDTIMVLDGVNGSSVASSGSDLFYLPHSIASDSLGNLWVSDVGRHQVMRLPLATASGGAAPGRRLWPDLVLGEPFEPGQDHAHFCKPSEIAASSNGALVFIADGYCNNRIKVYTGQGAYLASFGQEQGMRVVHSLSLIEERDLICAADRENARILCFRAGLSNLAQLGQFAFGLDYPLGQVYALLAISSDHLLVSSKRLNSNHYDLALMNPFEAQQLRVVWTSGDLLEPHSLARTADQAPGEPAQVAYAADLARNSFKKVFKFDIIQTPAKL